MTLKMTVIYINTIKSFNTKNNIILTKGNNITIIFDEIVEGLTQQSKGFQEKMLFTEMSIKKYNPMIRLYFIYEITK